MRRVLFTGLLTCCMTGPSAQTSITNHHEDIMKIKGKWSKDANLDTGVDPAFPKSQNGQLYKRIDSMTAMLKYAYPNPMGMEAIHYSSIRDRPVGTGTPAAYTHKSLYKSYYYNQHLKKIFLVDETHTTVYMYVNYFGWFFNIKMGRYVVDKKEVTVFILNERDGTWNGYPAFKRFRGRPERTVVISRDGELPYIPITQKQFLIFTRAQKVKQRKEFLKSDSAYHSYLLKQIETARTGKQANDAARDKAVKSAEFYYEEYKKRRASRGPFEEEELAKQLKLIDDYLSSHSETELAQPVKTPSLGDFNGSFEPKGRNAKLNELVRINFAYFKKEAPRYVPQFVVLYWTWTEEDDPPSIDFKRQFEENFPVQRLKALLDK